MTALPISLDHNAGLPGLISSMILISIGVGGVKATLPPFLGTNSFNAADDCLHSLVDQYAEMKPRQFKNRSGTLVLSDRTLTVQYICNVFYWYESVSFFVV